MPWKALPFEGESIFLSEIIRISRIIQMVPSFIQTNLLLAGSGLRFFCYFTLVFLNMLYEQMPMQSIEECKVKIASIYRYHHYIRKLLLIHFLHIWGITKRQSCFSQIVSSQKKKRQDEESKVFESIRATRQFYISYGICASEIWWENTYNSNLGSSLQVQNLLLREDAASYLKIRCQRLVGVRNNMMFRLLCKCFRFSWTNNYWSYLVFQQIELGKRHWAANTTSQEFHV